MNRPPIPRGMTGWGDRPLRATKIGDVLCYLVVECYAMSALVAVCESDTSDVIFCSEGKEILTKPVLGPNGPEGESFRPLRDDCQKILALNERVCIGVVGSSDGMHVLLKRMLPDLPWTDYDIWTPPFNFLDTLEKPLTTMRLIEVRDEILRIMREASTCSTLGSRYLAESQVVVGGSEDGVSQLYLYRRSENEFDFLKTQVAYGPPPAKYFVPSTRFKIPDDVAVEIVLKNCHQLPSFEHRCAEAIEEYARHSAVCNDNVMFRRLSRGFILESEDDVLAR